MSTPVVDRPLAEAPITVEELQAAFDLESEPACEGSLLPECLMCGMDCSGCTEPAEWAVRNDCGCLYLIGRECRLRISAHFITHPRAVPTWPCTKCGRAVLGILSSWTLL